MTRNHGEKVVSFLVGGTMMEKGKLRICLDKESFCEKPNNQIAKALSARIVSEEVELTIENIAHEVGVKGKTFTPAIFYGKKKDINGFNKMQLYVLDFDGNIKYRDVEARAKQYSLGIAFAYRTFSNCETKEKFRVVFMLDAVVDRANISKWILDMLHVIFPEADQSGKDIVHMYYGGKGLINENYETIDLCRCIDAFSMILLANDKNRNYSRIYKRYSAKYNIGIRDKPYVFDVTRVKNDADLPNDNYIYLLNGRLASIYKIALCDHEQERGGALIADTYAENENVKKNYHKRYRSNILLEYNKCKLLRDFFEKRKLSHSEKMHILYNVIFIEGGERFFLDNISAVTTDVNQWKVTLKYCKDKYDKPESCCGCNFECKYSNNCDSKNIIQCLVHKPRIRRVNSELFYSLKEAEKDFGDKFSTAMNISENKVCVIKAQTAIGKTNTYIEYIKAHNQQFFYIALPTNQLKNEVACRLRKEEIDVAVSPSVDDFEVPIDIERMYELGHSSSVKKILKNYIKSFNGEDNENIQKIRDFITFNDHIKSKEFRVVVTTHIQFLMTQWIIPDDYKIIVDEDILMTIFRSHRTILEKDIIRLSESFEIPRKDRDKFNELLEYKERLPRCIDYRWSEIDTKLLFKLDISSAVGYLKKGSIISRDNQHNFIIMEPFKIDRKIVVLSATANKVLYQKYFHDCEFYDCKKARYEGVVLQYCKYCLSRKQYETLGKKVIKNGVKDIVGDAEIITFKKHSEGCVYLGNSSGYDFLKGKDLAIVGTYHVNPILYEMIYYCLQGKVNNETPKNRQIKFGNYEFIFFSYEDVLMREIQNWLVSSELEQCIGRARLLREQCTVYVFSDFPAEQATFIEEDYLK